MNMGKQSAGNLLPAAIFQEAYASDSSGVVINEAAAEYMELKNPLGKQSPGNGVTMYLSLIQF